MSYEILSVKLQELDQKIGQMHNRIRCSESEGHDRVKEEVRALQKECMENEAALYDRLKNSKAGVVSRLADAYQEIEQIIRKAKESFCSAGNEDDDRLVEEKILFAEYGLDFAVQAADHALLAAMESLDAQMTQQEKEEKKI